MKFAVLGDTHYCLNDSESMLDKNGNVTDAFLYSNTRENFYSFADKIRAEKVDFLVSCGDMIEGTYDDEKEFAEARQILISAAPEFYLVRGTHDPRGGSSFNSFEYDDCSFIFLDYTPRNWDSEQKKLFEEALQKSKNARRIFVFAHAPLYPWGRECFDSPDFRKDVESLLKKYPVDVFFCGHTHNQSLSMHEGNLIQVTASTIGLNEDVAQPLNRYHALRPIRENDRLFWGISEFSAPGYWIVELAGEKLSLKWHSLLASAEALQTQRFGELELVSLPPMHEINHVLSDFDRSQIRGAWLNIYSGERDCPSNAEVRLNGILLGSLPVNMSGAARRFLPLPLEALQKIGVCNDLTIGELGDNTVVLSANLEVVLADGRIIVSHPMNKVFMSGMHYTFEFIKDYAQKFSPGDTIECVLKFDSEITSSNIDF